MAKAPDRPVRPFIVLALILTAVLFADLAARDATLRFHRTSQPVQTPEENVAKAEITKAPVSKSDILTVLAKVPTASRFRALLKTANANGLIDKRGTYTLFVPTNSAFYQLPDEMIGSMSEEELDRLVRYHMVSGSAIDLESQVAGERETLSGDMLTFSQGMQNIPMVGSAVVIAEYSGSNGVMYLIDNVLLPPRRSGL